MKGRWTAGGGIAAGLVVVLLCGAAHAAGADDEAGLLALVNGSRQARSLPSLQRSPDLDEYARQHCRRLAARGALFHSTRDQLRALAGTSASRVAENVAVGQDVIEIHQDLMRSRGHRANILGDFGAVGLAIERGKDGRLYVTEVFVSRAPDRTRPHHLVQPLGTGQESKPYSRNLR